MNQEKISFDTVSSEQARIWGDVAKRRRNDQFASGLIELWDALLDGVYLAPNKMFLDAGCGSGEASRRAKVYGVRVHGFDLAQPMVDLAKELDPDGDYIQANAMSLPYEDNTFDSIIACNMIHFTPEPVSALKEIYRVLKPKGNFSISTVGMKDFDIRAVFDTAERLAGSKGSTPYRIQRLGGLESTLTNAGFSIKGMRTARTITKYESADDAWGQLSAIGGVNGACQVVGAELVRSEILNAIQSCRRTDGSYRLENWWPYAIASKA